MLQADWGDTRGHPGGRVSTAIIRGRGAIHLVGLFLAAVGGTENWNADTAESIACFERGDRTILWREVMATQIVMDHSGDTRHHFDAKDAQALAKAEARFKELTGRGFTAAVRSGPGEVTRVRSFDPSAEETLFFPRLVGG